MSTADIFDEIPADANSVRKQGARLARRWRSALRIGADGFGGDGGLRSAPPAASSGRVCDKKSTRTYFEIATNMAASKNQMTNVPSGTELARPFVPAKNLELSKRFYIRLGFEIALDSEVAIFRVGTGSFILSSFDQADNFMMQLMVDDLDAWWAHIAALNLPTEFGVPAPRAPEMQPWGLRLAYVVDPSGVLWHVAQRRPHKPHDR